MSTTSSIGAGSSAVQSAILGIQRGMANVSRDSQVVANGSAAGGSDNSVTNALVDAKQQSLNVEASAKALSITNQALGTLLDVKA
jgi:hypothetical protein